MDWLSIKADAPETPPLMMAGTNFAKKYLRDGPFQAPALTGN